jgi:hypothetical protein
MAPGKTTQRMYAEKDALHITAKMAHANMTSTAMNIDIRLMEQNVAMIFMMTGCIIV